MKTNEHDETKQADRGYESVLLNELEKYWRSIWQGNPVDSTHVLKGFPASSDDQTCFHAMRGLYETLRSVSDDSQQIAANVDLFSATGSTTLHHNNIHTKRLPLAIGQQVESYEVVELLGRGGQGATYLAVDAQLQRQVVLKVYHQAADRRSAILSEGRKLARVRNKYVPQCFAIESSGDLTFLVLEHVRGRSLQEVCQVKRYTVNAAMELISQVAEGVAAVHACGVLHRDLKPGNILVGDDGMPRLVDFGLAANLGDDVLGTPSGTLQYMAPEQARGDLDQIDQRIDVYGLGAVLYFLLTGLPLRTGDNLEQMRENACRGTISPIREVNPKLPLELDKICMRALAKDPNSRYESPLEFARAIRRYRSRNLILRRTAIAALVAGGVGLTYSTFFRTTGASRIEARVEVLQLFRENGYQDGNPIFDSPFRLRIDDGVKLRANLSRPAYSYWLAFLPDGTWEVCYEKSFVKPKRTDVAKYPQTDSKTFFKLANGLGPQVFVLVCSDSPLPKYIEWYDEMNDCPWLPKQLILDKEIRIHDGDWEHSRSLDPDHPRGSGARRQAKTTELEKLVAWLKSKQEWAAIVAWAIPVLPRTDSE